MLGRPITHLIVEHLTVEQSRLSASAAIARAYLFKFAGDRQKRIDHYIDYFGSGGMRRSVVTSGPGGESWLDADGAR
jgi:hypothetical protein